MSNLGIDDFDYKMKHDEANSLESIREEQIKELFKSADSKLFITKLRGIYQ